MAALPNTNATPPLPTAPTKAGGRRRALLAVASFFALKVAFGVVILAISAKRLSVAEFASFSQLFLFLALLSSVASGGVQNGVVREVAAAHGDIHREKRVIGGGIVIWACFSLPVMLAMLILQDVIATMLVGNRAVAPTVVGLTVIALLAGLGTLLCSALSGSNRAPLSLFIQGIGLVIGGALSIERLWAGDGERAVLFYALGPLVSAFLSVAASRHWLVRLSPGWREARREAVSLLTYSGAFLAVVSALPLVLFGTRYMYRLEFGAELLGYWLLANRASDVTTQIVGLYLSQVYLPQVTRSKTESERLTLIRRTLALGIAVAGAGALVFALASGPIVTLLLSDRYLPALPFVLGYLVGDMFRVGGNVALFTALAARRLKLFVSIESGLALLVGTAILAGIALGYPAAAWWGYLAAHATALTIVLFSLRRIARF